MKSQADRLIYRSYSGNTDWGWSGMWNNMISHTYPYIQGPHMNPLTPFHFTTHPEDEAYT